MCSVDRLLYTFSIYVLQAIHSNDSQIDKYDVIWMSDDKSAKLFRTWKFKY